MTDRKKKILLIQITLFIIAISLLYFTYYNKDLDTEKTSVERIENKEVEESDSKAVNVFEDIEYKGIDLNGNRFTIKSEIADFELETPELINMKIMSAIFYFKDGTILKVKGDYGTYNNKNNNMEFRDNIEAVYGQNYLYADNLDYLNSENSLTIYGNVKGEGIEGNIMADNLDFDLSLKTLNISMFSKNQINVKLKDQ